jgi:hypothetical protein
VEINRASLPAADELGEIVNPAVISTYFTERSAVYFYPISPARRGGYFYFLPNGGVPAKQSHTHHKLMRLVG